MKQKDQNNSELAHSPSAICHNEIPVGKDMNRSQASTSQYIKGMIKSQPPLLTAAILTAYGFICFMGKPRFVTLPIPKRRIRVQQQIVGAVSLCAAAGCFALAYKIGTNELEPAEN